MGIAHVAAPPAIANLGNQEANEEVVDTHHEALHAAGNESSLGENSDGWEDVPFHLGPGDESVLPSLQPSTGEPSMQSAPERGTSSMAAWLPAIISTLLPRKRDSQPRELAIQQQSSSEASPSSEARPLGLREEPTASSGRLGQRNPVLTAGPVSGNEQASMQSTLVQGTACSVSLKGKEKYSPTEESGNESLESAPCCICFDNPKNAALVPCGHRMCVDCSVIVKEKRGGCPVCNRPIDSVLRLYG
jgi:hypothetical protein